MSSEEEKLEEILAKMIRGSRQRRIINLSADELAVETSSGFWVVVPGWNLDVAIGIIRDGEIEPWTAAVFTSLLEPGNTVINVGANFGYYAAMAARRVGADGKVFAVEANPVVFPFLVKTAFWSGVPDIIRSYNFAAVGPDQAEQVLDFAFDPQFIGGGNLFSRSGNHRETQDCLWTEEIVEEILDGQRKFIPRGIFSQVKTRGRTIDSVVDGGVNAMLIDAEGSECFVISGARDAIRQSPDLSIIMEWSPHSYRAFPGHRDRINAMWDFLLDEQGFSVQRICPESFAGGGSMPTLESVTRSGLMEVPHSDLLLKRTDRD